MLLSPAFAATRRSNAEQWCEANARLLVTVSSRESCKTVQLEGRSLAMRAHMGPIIGVVGSCCWWDWSFSWLDKLGKVEVPVEQRPLLSGFSSSPTDPSARVLLA